MGLIKVNGSVAWGDAPKRGPANADPPQVLLYEDGRVALKYYATRLLALTCLSEPEILDRIRAAAEALQVPPDIPWTQEDAETLLEAGGMPPAPTHVQVAPLSGEPTYLVRAAEPGAKAARLLSYAKGSTRPTLRMLQYLRSKGVKIPPGTCLIAPVKLVETEGRLVLAILLRLSKSRGLHEVESEEDTAS